MLRATSVRRRERIARQLLVLAVAGSAGVHAALAPAHAAEGPAVALMFGLSAGLLGAVAVGVDRAGRPLVYALAAVLLAGLLTTYAASRLTALWPLAHAEHVDAIGLLTKLLEAAGLVSALCLLWTPADGTGAVRPTEGAGP